MAIFGEKSGDMGPKEGAGNDSLPNPDDDPRMMAATDMIDAFKAGDASALLSAFDRLQMQSEPEGDEGMELGDFEL